MTQTKPNPIVRLLPSLTDVAFLMPVVFLFARLDGLRSLLGDGDTGWHIRTGDWIRMHGQVPHQDVFSFTMPGQPWYAWEWLWDVGASWLHQHWSLGGVALASLLILCLTCALLFRLIYRRCGNPIVSIGLTFLAAAGSTIHWLARPHLVTLLFTVIFLTILERVREGKTGLLWWLPVLTILWTNMHGGFIVGLSILGAYGAGELLRALVSGVGSDGVAHGRAAAKASLPYFAAAGGCLAASLINPYFYGLHVHLVEYLNNPYALQYIQEFQSANFHHSAAPYLEIMLVLGVGSAAWFALRKQFGDALLMMAWAHLALIAARNIPIFLFLAAPMVGVALVEGLRSLRQARVARWLARTAEEFEDIGGDMRPIESIRRVHFISALVIVVIALAMDTPGASTKLTAKYDETRYPEHALAMLNPSQRIFTNDEWGDYLIYRLSPSGTKVFVDGRSDFYGEDFGREYIDLLDVKYNWQETLAKYQIDTVLLRPSAALASTIKESSRWRVVYDDGTAIVFRSVKSLHTATELPPVTSGESSSIRLNPVDCKNNTCKESKL